MTTSPGPLRSIRQSRRKIALVCIACALFVAAGAWFIAHPEQAASSRYSRQEVLLTGWSATPLFAMALIAWLIVLARPATISLDPSGITITTIWKSYRRPWLALSNFQARSFGTTKLIVFDDTDPASGRWWARVNSALRGTNSSLPAMLDRQPEEILEALRAAKANWG